VWGGYVESALCPAAGSVLFERREYKCVAESVFVGAVESAFAVADSFSTLPLW